jgi:vacuolar-type H+-ATPase subunit I/STV1
VTIDELRDKRKSCWAELKRINSMLQGIKITLKEIEEQYKCAKAEYEKVDYDLALVDGRLHREEDAGTQARKKEKEDIHELISKLSEQEIDDVLRQLGVAVPEVEEVPDAPEHIVKLMEEPEDDK